MPSSASNKRPVSFAIFFLLWAEVQGWEVPPLHIAICDWLERRGLDAVLMVFRGAGKSTLTALYEAWRLYQDRQYRLLNQSADDPTARKLSRDVQHILRRHPLCKGVLDKRAKAVERFSVNGATDQRNASVSAHGVMSNVTSSRADEVVFDDAEVPKNIKKAESRETLRARVSESAHILVPGGRRLFIGTPHTHESIYDEEIAQGADLLKIPLFTTHQRVEKNTARQIKLKITPEADGLYVFHGKRLLTEGMDYEIKGKTLMTRKALPGLIDIYSGNAWPERFTREDLASRRRRCKSTNEWDSQYMLESRPIHEIRLDPDQMIIYDVEPVIKVVNKQVSMHLGRVRVVGASAYWDVATGRPDGDDSVLAVVFTDDRGHLYWHVAEALQGDVWEQARRIRQIAVEYNLPLINVEVNGPGAFAPQILRKVLAGTGCAVAEITRVSQKDRYILDSLEAPLTGSFLRAPDRLMDTKLPGQMRDWVPGDRDQADDFLDAGAGAIKQTPVRIGKVIIDTEAMGRREWRPSSGTYEVTVERH